MSGFPKTDIRVDVGCARMDFNDLRNGLASSRSCATSGTKHLDFDGMIDTGQIVDLVLHERHKFGCQLGHFCFQLLLQRIVDFDPCATLTGRL